MDIPSPARIVDTNIRLLVFLKSALRQRWEAKGLAEAQVPEALDLKRRGKP